MAGKKRVRRTRYSGGIGVRRPIGHFSGDAYVARVHLVRQADIIPPLPRGTKLRRLRHTHPPLPLGNRDRLQRCHRPCGIPRNDDSLHPRDASDRLYDAVDGGLQKLGLSFLENLC